MRSFRSAGGVEIIRNPFRAPKANAYAERWVGTVRRDCLDWLLISSRRQLERVLRVYVDHYNTHRPHCAIVKGVKTGFGAGPSF
jgi:putative transposase